MVPKISKLEDPKVKKKLNQINSQHLQQLRIIKRNHEQEMKNNMKVEKTEKIRVIKAKRKISVVTQS